MPILWRYALQRYLRIFFLSVCTFIAVLIVSRFRDIARFAALTGDLGKTGMFILYHIPSILPMAIPISALIGSFLFFQSLSRSFELTALRSSGLRLQAIIAPLLAASALLSIFNFSVCAEIGPDCRREGKMMIYQATSENPLLLLQRQNLVKLKDAFIQMEVEDEKTAKDLTLIVPNEKTKRLTLFSARKLWIEKEELRGEDLAIISYLDGEEGFDSLILENQKEMSTGAPLLSSALKKNRPHLDLNGCNLKMLFLTEKTKQARIEILRRISLSLAPFSFTFLGSAFGIEQGRNGSKKNLFSALLLTLSVLLSYLLGKELKNSPFLAIFAFLLPHPFIWISSIYRLYRISKGRIG